MEIKVLTRSKQAGISELLGNSAAFFAKKLNVEKCNYKVYICTKRNLKREGHMGLCAKTGEREITIAVDSNLPLPNILYTLAHEMAHQYQWDVYRWDHQEIYGRDPNTKTSGHGPSFHAWRDEFEYYFH